MLIAGRGASQLVREQTSFVYASSGTTSSPLGLRGNKLGNVLIYSINGMEQEREERSVYKSAESVSR